jgi:two-component system, chemotaxis family, sensor kinase CheA
MEDEILKEFLAESWENLGRLDSEIVGLEKNPGDKELLASIFRTIHTIKGTCGFIGLTGLGAVAHSAENVLGKMRDGALAASQVTISPVLEAVDEIKFLLHGLEASGKEPARDNSDLIRRLDVIATGIEAALADAPVTAPLATASSVAPPAHSVPATVSVPAAAVAAEPVTAPGPAKSNGPALSANAELTGEHPTADGDGASRSVADLTIRVNVDVVDRLMNMVGELVLTRNQLLQMVRGEDESKYAAPITHLNRVTTDLQEAVMKTRMQPIGNAWSKLPRVVRDLAKTLSKQIDLMMTGAETELDRTVLDAIKDPLTHMVRNSADHGIETPAVRRAAGKPEMGTVRLNAFHEGGHVIICIEDDGAGINVDRVKQKAVQNGLITEADAARMNEKEALSLIFHAGLSTAEQVTSVSGRGVGMDVVRTQIERIGGTVELASRRGSGTTVRIKIPLTLAIVSALVVEGGGLPFAIPQLGIVELVRLGAEDRHRIEKIHDKAVFRLRNRLLPLVGLDDVLGLERKRAETDDVNIVVVQVGDDQFGLIVDEVFDTEEIVVKPVGQLLKSVPLYQGITILGDGRVIMILDVAGVAASFGGIGGQTSERDVAHEGEDDQSGTTSLLLFESQPGTMMAVPLSLVARLEEFPRSAIEQTGDRLVVQYRGNLLPLLPIEGDYRGTEVDPQPVVVFSEGAHSMGLMVSSIQDILEERLVIRMQSRRAGVLGTAIIDARATDLIDTHYYVMQANPEWFTKKPDLKPKRVLVVDDSIFFRQLVTTALENEGYRVRAVDGAKQALRCLDGGDAFDCVVSDIEMPEMSGWEFAKAVRERGWAELPLLALTSLAGANQESKAMRAGFNRFQQKFNVDRFLAAVDDLISESQPGQQEASA